VKHGPGSRACRLSASSNAAADTPRGEAPALRGGDRGRRPPPAMPSPRRGIDARCPKAWPARCGLKWAGAHALTFSSSTMRRTAPRASMRSLWTV
jgi:hypothetical protein